MMTAGIFTVSYTRSLKKDNQAKEAQVKNLQNQVDALKKENEDTKAKLALIMAKLGM